MTDNPERRKFLKAALAAMAGVAGISTTSCLGAACYSRMGPPRRVQTICTVCKRTTWEGEKDKIFRSYNIPLKRIQDQGINAKLIMPEHCAECGFGLQGGKFQVELKYPDRATPVRIKLEFASDLEAIAIHEVKEKTP
ncbi:MAG: twin-arginine translocation signal domain-containing protein [Planctomycetaceae bacterium]|nr:twin-arginine translocation signal domain-containing protein [Planctomycetaceae bacterium]